MAVDAVFDSVSVATTFRATLAKAGVIFCPISEAVREHPELVRKCLGTVVPQNDNFFAALNSAVFTDGSFVYIPKGVRCPMELSTYFRINARNTGQFERTLIIAEAGSYVSYLEGCTAPQRDENQLHAAVVELVALEDARIKYSTVQNWYPGDAEGRGGIYNFVTKRGACRGARSRDQLDAGGDRFGDHLEISELHPAGRRQRWRVLLGRGDHQPAAGRYRDQDDPYRQEHALDDRQQGDQRRRSNNTYRGQVRVMPRAAGARNHTQCDSLLIGDSAARTPCPTSKAATRRRRWNTRRRPRRSPRTSCFTADSADCRKRTRST